MALNNRGAPTGIRRTHLLQRAAGKLFYQWAEVNVAISLLKTAFGYFQDLKYFFIQAIGARLEEFMIQDKQNFERVKGMVADESKHRDLLVEDEEEDFLDECELITPIYTQTFASN